MASQIAGKASLRNSYGIKVERLTAVLPATGNQTIFTISGGRIILTTLIAEVTTVMSATATNLKWTVVPTAGANIDLTANTVVTSLAVGTELAFTTLGAAASIGAAVTQNNETFIVPGILRATTDATNTGAVKYTLLYFPLDDGASVTAA